MKNNDVAFFVFFITGAIYHKTKLINLNMQSQCFMAQHETFN